MKDESLIVLYSKYDFECKRLFEMYESMPQPYMQFVCVDNERVRAKFMKNMGVSSVPCVIIREGSRYQVWEHVAIAQWIEQKLVQFNDLFAHNSEPPAHNFERYPKDQLFDAYTQPTEPPRPSNEVQNREPPRDPAQAGTSLGQGYSDLRTTPEPAHQTTPYMGETGGAGQNMPQQALSSLGGTATSDTNEGSSAVMGAASLFEQNREQFTARMAPKGNPVHSLAEQMAKERDALNTQLIPPQLREFESQKQQRMQASFAEQEQMRKTQLGMS